ncbi:MAG: succinyldiaminopimelate transaminase [Streptosporangiaceae bacterium]
MPRFPWDLLASYGQKARAHPDGIVDLSVGTPVDPVPGVVQDALRAAANAPGYPATHGTRALREAAAGWLARRHEVTVEPDAVLPLIGTKEFIASLPALLGCGPGDVVVYPELAYPTYDIGARLAGADAVAADALPPAGLVPAPQASATKTTTSNAPGPVRLAWVNSPSNPTGRVLSAGQLAAAARAVRERGAVLASDECYIGLGWTAEPVSVLHPEVCGGSFDGLLAVHSVSKRSNLAGYRAGFVTGDPALVAELLEIRKHAGMMMPAPVQAAMAAALGDDEHAERQREVYAARRDQLRAALEKAGWTITHSEAGLYLWASRPGLDCWSSVDLLAGAGILVAPGEFYGPAGAQHIRVALTATDEQVAAAARRLATLA